MASAQIPGVLRVYRKDPMGNLIKLYEADIQAIGNGGSSDGSITNSYEKWAFITPVEAPEKVLHPNDHLVVSFEAVAGATTDASDGCVSLPLTAVGGGSLMLGKFTSTTDWDVQQLGDVALLAQEIVIAERTMRETAVLGSNKVRAFVSVENNA